ncbi:MAG: prephenate dehydrogenase/arogenate dehydrogenase family protein [Kiritimatiellales bacterium]
MNTIAIIGAGMMGASLGLALKKRGVPVRIHAFARRAEARTQLLACSAADSVFDSAPAAVKNANIVVFCAPVLSIPALVKECRTALSAGAILTDVGSTKSCLHQLIPAALTGRNDLHYIGSHPVCGSEQQGVNAGDADLFAGALTIVTPDNAAPEHIEKVIALWKSTGSKTVTMSADKHDEILAATSHLPHVTAAALVLTANAAGEFAGSGFRDTTRVAGGAPQIWSDIVRTNTPPLKNVLAELRRNLDAFEQLLDSGDEEKITAWFAAAREKRNKLLIPNEH